MVALTPGNTLSLQPHIVLEKQAVQERQAKQQSITPDQSYLDSLTNLSVVPDQAPPLEPNLNPTNPAVFNRLAPTDPQNLALADITATPDIAAGVNGNSPVFTIRQEYLDQQLEAASLGASRNVAANITPEVEVDPTAVRETEIIKAGLLAPLALPIEGLRIAEVAQQLDKEEREAA